MAQIAFLEKIKMHLAAQKKGTKKKKAPGGLRPFHLCVYLQQNKKGRRPRVKIVILKL
jgi:hypothetical protein